MRKSKKQDREQEHQDALKSQMRSTSMVAAFGELFCDNQKDKNDWKTRMLKAGLGNMGLSVPDDWDTLSEDEKEKRLNGVLEILKEDK